MRQIVFALISLVWLSSCKSFKQVECTGVKGFKITQMNTDGLKGDILLSIKNPNSFGFSIYKSEFDVTYSGIYLGKAKLAKRVKIKGNEEKTYAFNLKSDLENVNLVDVMKLVAGGAFKNKIEIKGDLKVGKFLIRKKLPVNLNEKVKLN